MTSRFKRLASIFGWAGLGGLCRYWLGLLLPDLVSLLLINLLGTFCLLALAKGYLVHRKSHPNHILGVGTGFSGGFTSFSSLVLDLTRLGESGQYSLALLYLLAHLIGGLLVAHLALTLARKQGWT